jgi:hypothetical protein
MHKSSKDAPLAAVVSAPGMSVSAAKASASRLNGVRWPTAGMTRAVLTRENTEAQRAFFEELTLAAISERLTVFGTQQFMTTSAWPARRTVI